MKYSAICPQAGSRIYHHLQSSPRRMRFPAVGSKPLRIQIQTDRVGRPFSAITQFNPAQPGTAFAPRRRCSGTQFLVSGDGSLSSRSRPLGSRNHSLSSRDGCRSSRSRPLSSRDRSGSSRSHPLGSRNRCGSLGNDRQNPPFASRLPVNNIKTNDLQC